MGVDFDVILDHHFDRTNIIDLPHHLNQNADVAGAIARLRSHFDDFHRWNYSHLDREPVWRWHDATKHGWDGIDPAPILTGPDHYGWMVYLNMPLVPDLITFGPHVCTFQPHARWHLVWEHEECLTEVRRFVWTLAQAFGGHRAIYVPDSGPYKSSTATDLMDTATLDEIQQWLLQNVGQPLTLEPQTMDEATYAVDDFTDLNVQ